MNPRVSKPGTSFVGAALYYSHDKKADTSDRLGFVDFVNLPIEATGHGPSDSERAAKIMAFTAMHWEDLQRTWHNADLTKKKPYRPPPNPIERPVYSYSLRFHPHDKDKITPELLRQAAQQSLKKLGMEDLQAVIYEHTDFEKTEEFPDHPSHIHVLVNRVHPLTGKAHNVFRDHLTLSKFCEEFGKTHGLKKVNRRIANNERRNNGEFVYYKGYSREDYDRFRSYKGADPKRVTRLREARQAVDEKNLENRISKRKALFEEAQKAAYDPVIKSLNQRLEQQQKKIDLDGMNLVLRVFTRLKKRITGELIKEIKSIEKLKRDINRTLREIDVRKRLEQRDFDKEINALKAKQAAVHAAQEGKDEEYFRWLRNRRKTETSGESGRGAFNARVLSDSNKAPQGGLKPHIIDEQHKSAADPAEDAVSRVARKMGKQKPAPVRPDDANTTPEEAVKKLYRGKRQKSTREPGRKRKPRTKNRSRKRD